MLKKSIASLSLTPSQTTALQKAGFSTVEDLKGLGADEIARETGLPQPTCDGILRSLAPRAPPRSQAAASLLAVTEQTFRICEPVDKLLGSGLRRGSVLELSGPPGSRKENITQQTAVKAIKSGAEVLIIDCQNMILPAMLIRELRDVPQYKDRTNYVRCLSLSDFMVFFLNLSRYLDAHPNISLLVVCTLSFLFQAAALSRAARSSVLGQVKNIITRVCASNHVAMMFTTQLATRMIGVDGEAANFDTADRAVMVPALDDSYLPQNRTHRIMLVPCSPTTGVVRLLSSPERTHEQCKSNLIQEAYEMYDGQMRCKSE